VGRHRPADGGALRERPALTAIDGLACVVIDCAAPEPLARWWQGLLGGTVTVDADGDAMLRAPGRPRLDFLRVPETKSIKNRVHLDLATTDLAAALGQALAHGAVLAPDVCPPGDRFAVLRDPESNEFCLLAPDAAGPW
jgi:hypothetical protein